MCGLVYCRRHDDKPAAKIILKRFKKQATRGRRGFGYITIRDGYVENVVRAQDEKEMEEMLKRETAQEILFHHRLPTSTPNYYGTTHPIVVEDKRFKKIYYVMHNGVIRNSDKLKEQHEEEGLMYLTAYEENTVITFPNSSEETIESKLGYNDSESFAKELALFLNGKDEIETYGTVSFIALQTNKRGKAEALFYGHNTGNPLIEEVVNKNKRRKKNQYFVLKSVGNGMDVPVNFLHRYDYATGETKTNPVKIGSYYEVKNTRTVGQRYRNEKQNYLPPGFHREQEQLRWDDEEVRQYERDAYDLDAHLETKFDLQEVKDMRKRVETIEEELISLEEDRKTWEGMCKRPRVSMEDKRVAQYEIDAVMDREKQLRIEKFNLDRSIREYEQDMEDAMASPYQSDINW